MLHFPEGKAFVGNENEWSTSLKEVMYSSKQKAIYVPDIKYIKYIK